MLDIAGYKNYLYEEELSASTIEAYIYSITKFATMFDEVTKSNVILYKQWLTQNFKPKTVNLRLAGIMRYCDYKEIPMKIKNIKEPKLTHFENVITPEQYDKLIARLEADNNERWLAHIKLLAKTGMRVNEANRVKKCDLLRGYVTMNAKAHMRTILFPKSLVDDISHYLDKLEDNDTVMQSARGGPITDRGISEALKKFAIKYDIPKEVMHPHSFRHFFAIEFIKRKNDIALLADLLGHGSVNVTQIYLRQSQEQQKRAIDEAVDW